MTIVLGGGLPRRGGGEVAGVDRLAAALARCPGARLDGLRVVIDGGFGAALHRSRAEIVLGVCCGEERWVEALGSDAAAEVAAERRALGGAERFAAERIGVANVLYQVGADDDDDETAQRNYGRYVGFLGAARDGARFEGVGSLSLVLVGAPKSAMGKGFFSGSAECVIDSDVGEGLVRVGVEAGAEEIMMALAGEGASVAAVHDTIVAEAEAERRRVWRTARALRVEEVERGENVSAEQWHRALTDLLSNAGLLGGILDRSRVVVGTESKVGSGGEVQIAWNFLDTLPLE